MVNINFSCFTFKSVCLSIFVWLTELHLLLSKSCLQSSGLLPKNRSQTSSNPEAEADSYGGCICKSLHSMHVSCGTSFHQGNVSVNLINLYIYTVFKHLQLKCKSNIKLEHQDLPKCSVLSEYFILPVLTYLSISGFSVCLLKACVGQEIS